MMKRRRLQVAAVKMAAAEMLTAILLSTTTKAYAMSYSFSTFSSLLPCQ
jgi:hypothetical protein